MARGHTSLDLTQGTPPGVMGRPLNVALKDYNLGVAFGTQMELCVWSKGDNSLAHRHKNLSFIIFRGWILFYEV